MIGRAESLDLVVIGGAAMDWVATVGSLPAPDELVVAHDLNRFAGGSAANVAVGVARLGHRVGFVGKLGDDKAGRALLQAFREEGVDTAEVRIAAGRRTAACFIGLDDRGERMIFALPGVSLIEDPAELDPSYWRRTRLLYIGPSYPGVALAAATACHESGRTAVFAPGGGWDATGLSELEAILQRTDLLLLSRSEALRLTGLSSLTEALGRLATICPAALLATRGAAGALLLEGGRMTEIPAFPMTTVCDTTGAGDAFAAGLLASFLEGRSWAESARRGSVAAALKVRRLGARNGLPSRQEIAKAMREVESGRVI